MDLTWLENEPDASTLDNQCYHVDDDRGCLRKDHLQARPQRPQR